MAVVALAFEATPPVFWKDSLVLARSLVVGTDEVCFEALAGGQLLPVRTVQNEN